MVVGGGVLVDVHVWLMSIQTKSKVDGRTRVSTGHKVVCSHWPCLVVLRVYIHVHVCIFCMVEVSLSVFVVPVCYALSFQLVLVPVLNEKAARYMIEGGIYT